MKVKKLIGNKWFRRLGLPVLILLFLTLITALSVNLYFSPIFSKQLKKTVFRLSNGLYQVDFDKSSLHVLAGRIVIDHLSLKPNTTVFNKLKKAGKAPNNLYTLAVDRIVLKHIHPFKLYFKKELDVDEISISQPYVQAIYQELNNHIALDSSKKTYYQQIAGTLKSAHIGQILLDNINLRYQEEINHHLKITHLKEINLQATDLLIDSASEKDKSRFNFCKDITAVFNNYSGRTEDNLYRYQAKSVTFSSSQASVKIKDAVFMPQNMVNPSAKLILQQRKFSLATDSIRINHFDYKAFVRHRNLIASDVTVFNGKAEIFYDRTIPKKPADLSKSGLYTLLKNVHRDIAVKALQFRDVDLVYSEISAKTKLRGVITFEQMHGSVNNIITGNDTIGTNRKLTANLAANLMGYGKLEVNLNFDPADSANVLYYKGSLGPMNLVNLNPATKPLGLIQFTNGIVTSLNFDMQAKTQKATGTLTFLYHDLNVVLLKQDEKKALSRMSFISILANAFVLLRDNPTFGNPPRVVTVAFERPQNVSYLGLLWRSVYTGIKESIGLSTEIEQNLRQKVADYKQNKEQRLLKKTARQEKRKVRRLKRHLKEARDY